MHELEIYQIWGGLTMYDEADGQTQNPSWHGVITCGDGSGHWDNDPNSPLDTKLYDVAGGANPGLFAGQSTASLSLMIRPKDHATWSGGAVESQAVRIHAAWTAEGTGFEAQTTISQLPVTVYPQTTSAIDAEVSHDDSVTWDWQYDIPYGSAHEHTVAWGGDPATDAWVATSHDTPELAAGELTEVRAGAVCDALGGKATAADIAAAAAAWAEDAVPSRTGPGTAWPSDEEDARHVDIWCLVCLGSGDCDPLAELSVAACRLVGLTATRDRAYAQPPPGPGEPPLVDADWLAQQACFAPGYEVQHQHYDLWYWSGMTLNEWEGFFTVQGSTDYYTAYPLGTWPGLGQMITGLSTRYACARYIVWLDEWYVWDHMDPRLTNHALPEPTVP
ncbi:MAG: hypothetical protein GF320_03585 [Armatimonadia bacterium]|nr:hypothetical protein [Armatimonadia bacterium]